MATYKELLEQQMKKSDQFSKENLGSRVGPDFSEFVKDVTQSKALSATMLVNVALIGLVGGKQLAESMKGTENDPDTLEKAVLKNATLFEIPLSLLYWGIQIGKNMQEVNELEKLFGKEK